ncbi:hypothetical protein [Macrococcus carouselicus]|uniref:Uncharacterized protein n=1 Tax=Macrococcus carouselicus TaxID=69969 RepID=A0A9Q8CK46_9STAP|nr:hypothetical protein [Macrococcus carouselicus]TDM04203.1 hypothetical protein ERX40_03270 [Macrococcus carouselicus]
MDSKDYIIQEFELLRHRLKIDLEEFYQIKIEDYRDKIPMIYLENEKQMSLANIIRDFINRYKQQK